MYPDESLFLGPEGAPPAGPLILGVPWPVPPGLVRTAAELAAGLEVHLVCAVVDPASYLTEWEPLRTLSAVHSTRRQTPAGRPRSRQWTCGARWSGSLGPGDRDGPSAC